jgi:hypothetical protein
MSQPLKRQSVIALFGQEAGTKLYTFLNECCEGGFGKPALPLGSIQYNNAGAFFGDSEFIRDPVTQQTIIASKNGDILIYQIGAGLVVIGSPTAYTEYNPVANSVFTQALLAEMGDVNNAGNGHTVVVDDVNKIVRFRSPLGKSIIGDSTLAGNSTLIEVDDLTELVKITNVPIFADDAAAGVGGLVTGQLYKTTTGGSTFLKIVP